MKKRKNLICFDLDNTLVYADGVHIPAFNQAFAMNGLPRAKAKTLKRLFGLVGRRIVHILFPHLNDREISKVMKDHNNLVINKTARLVKTIKGVKRALKKLKQKYEIAILSNCTHREILAILKAAGISRQMFDLIIGHDEVKHPKPAPDEIFKAEHLMHLKKGYMVGDTIYDIRAAKKAGLKPIAVLTGNQSREMLSKEKPFMILKSVAELPKALEK